ncbi:hypothetical protein AAC387_Pa11g0929 [Persea americana]
MVNYSKESFSFSAIGKFVGRRPSLEALEQWVHSSWTLSRPVFIFLTEKGHFLFRFSCKEDIDSLVSHNPLLMVKRKLLLQSWSPGQDEASWPAVSPIWICLKGIPYHCWSSNIILSIASSIGKPLHLDDTTASQRILSYARVLVNFDVGKPGARLLSVDMEGEGVVEVEVLYENIPCSECLSSGHLQAKCPFTHKLGIWKTPTPAPSLQPVSLESNHEPRASEVHNRSHSFDTFVHQTSSTTPSATHLILTSPCINPPPAQDIRI